jgi:hypothetical protein
MYKFIQTRFFLPDDLVQLVTSFLWKSAKLSADELSEDLSFYCLWRKAVPPIFLKCAILDTSQWFHVANPMRDGHPYWPRKLLDITPKNVWGEPLFAFGTMICRERIREVRTYKRCALRWIRNCTDNINIWYWYDLQMKLLNKIKIEHFRHRAHRGFLEEALQQLSFYTISFASSEASLSPSAKSRRRP